MVSAKEALALCLEVVFSLEAVFSLEVPPGVCALEEGVELAVFLAVGFCGSIVEVSAMVCES